MREIRRFMLGLAGCVLALATIPSLSAQTADGIAKVVAIGGNAQYFVPGETKPHILEVGTVLKPGTIIQTATGVGNYVDIVLNNSHAVEAPEASPSEIANYGQKPMAEQDGIRLKENTVLSIDKLTVTQTGADTVTDTELDLKAGKILGTVKKLSPTSKYEVKIPNGVAGIRGTIYSLSASGILQVLTGAVVLAYVGPDGNVVTQVVNAGEQFDISTGLITPISAPNMGDLIHDAVQFRTFFANQPTTYVTPDHRIYFISPIKGRHHGPPPGVPPGGG